MTSIADNSAPKALEAARFRQVLTILFLALLVPCSRAQNLTAVTADARRPGDMIRVVLTFDGPVTLSSAGFRFNQQKLTEPSQKPWPAFFNGTNLKQLANPSQWEVSGPVPEFTSSGEYRLDTVWVGVADLGKNYQVADFVHNPITVTIINERKDPIPALRDVTLTLAK